MVLGLLAVGCWEAGNREVAFLKLIKILELFFLGYYVAKNNYTLNARRYLLVGVIYSSLIAIGQFLKQRSLGGIFWWLGERSFTLATPGIARTEFNGQLFLRPYATFSHPNALAGFFLVSLILTLPVLWRRSKKVALGYLLLAICPLILTFSRPVWLAGILVLIFGAVQSIKPKKFLCSFLFLAPESFFSRQELNETAVQLIKSQPLFGVGLGSFLIRSSFSDFIQPVHNIYLLLASETGGIVFIGTVIFIIRTIKMAWANWSLLAGLGVILFTGLFDHYWLTLQQNQLLLALVLGWCWQKKTGLQV